MRDCRDSPFSPFTGRRCRQADEGQSQRGRSWLPLIRHFVTPSPRKRGEGKRASTLPSRACRGSSTSPPRPRNRRAR
ncbi:MAG: hypothetical protein EOR45_27775 [Mesorhizobium sp.]|nr:MAG: hypothetical protein EOR45_27775 [Mesorhizobium sp.]